MVFNGLSVQPLWGYVLMILMVAYGTKGQRTNSNNRCPEMQGFFLAPGTGQSQCLKVMLGGKVDWATAKERCRTEGVQLGVPEGFVLARPFNVRALKTYIFERYSQSDFWVGARGDGTQMIWTPDRLVPFENVETNSPFWKSGFSGANLNEASCMVMDTTANGIKSEFETYYTQMCSMNNHILCEYDLTKTRPAFVSRTGRY